MKIIFSEGNREFVQPALEILSEMNLLHSNSLYGNRGQFTIAKKRTVQYEFNNELPALSEKGFVSFLIDTIAEFSK